MSICICIYIYIWAYIYIYMSIYIYIWAYQHIYIYIYIYVYISYIKTHIHIYTYISISIKFECRNEGFPIPKWNPKGIHNYEKWIQKGTKRSKQTLYSTLSEQGRTSIEKGRRKGVRGAGFGKPFEEQNHKKTIPENMQKSITGTWKMTTTQCQKGTRNHIFYNLFEKR